MTIKSELQTEQTALSRADKESIEQTCLDFLDGWYTGDADRVSRALHPKLVKRSLARDPDRGWVLRKSVTREQMVEWARQGGGSEVPAAERVYDISIQHGFRHIAAVTAISPQYVDYLHLAKLGDRWVIANDLWELREGTLEG